MRTALITNELVFPVTVEVSDVVVFYFQNRLYIIPWPEDKTWVETIYEYLMKKDSKKIDVVYNPEHRAKGDLPFGSANDE